MHRSRPQSSGGFIVSLELILIFTVLIIGTLVGVMAVRNALFTLREGRLTSMVIVKDSTAPDPILIKPVNYDLCEAPQILCRDFGFTPADTMTPGPTEGLQALVGVRPDRFVSRNRIYFDAAGCTGTPYIAPPGDPSLPIGYFNCALQVDSAGDPVCYGVGPPSDFSTCTLGVDCTDGGLLYRNDGIVTSPIAVASRWISLNPDCADPGFPGGTTGELVVNGSFEIPVLADGGFVAAVGPTWALAGGAGTFNPLAVGPGLPDPPFDGPHFSPGAPPTLLPTQNVPAGVNTFFSNGGTATQTLVGVPAAASCLLSVWIGRRADFGPPTPPFVSPQSYSVTVSNSAPAVVGSIAGSITPASPEWARFVTPFTATGPGPFTLALTAGGVQVNFDAASVTCTTLAGGSGAVCEDVALTLDLLPTVEVVNAMAVNVLAVFEPNFSSMAWIPAVAYTPPAPEGAPVQDATAPGTTTDPGDPLSFEPPGDENDPPP